MSFCAVCTELASVCNHAMSGTRNRATRGTIALFAYSQAQKSRPVFGVFCSVQDLLVDGPRAGLVSREGYHRPFTRGGGCKFCLPPLHDPMPL